MKCDNIPLLVNRSLALILVGIIGYSLFAYGYAFSYCEVYLHHSKGAGITFIVTSSIFLLLVLIDWANILLLGPGKAKVQRPFQLYPDTSDSATPLPPPPDVFICDPQGYPLWCSTCQSIKTDRVHHSAELGYCVEKMDHMCHWIGTVVGRRNLRYFMLLQLHFLAAILIVLSTVSIYIRDIFRHEPVSRRIQICVLMGIAGFWCILLIPFMASNIKYILTNTTTIEHLKYYKRNPQFPIFNILLPQQYNQSLGVSSDTELRIVSRMRPGDPRPYQHGTFWQSWKLVFGGSPLYWVLPIPTIQTLKSLFGSHTSSFASPSSKSGPILPLTEDPSEPRSKASEAGNQTAATDPATDPATTPPWAQHNPKLITLMIDRFINGEEGYFAYPHLQNLPPNPHSGAIPAPEDRPLPPTPAAAPPPHPPDISPAGGVPVSTPGTGTLALTPQRNSPLDSLQPESPDLGGSSLNTDTAALIN